jgi:hypothetical protein
MRHVEDVGKGIEFAAASMGDSFLNLWALR